MSIFTMCSFIITFITLGLSVSLPGPSMMFLEEIVYAWEDEMALIFTWRAVGALGGWLLSATLMEDALKHCGCLIGFGLFGLTLVNFGIAFSYHLWWLMAAFAFQGGFIVLAGQGCLAYVTKHSTCSKNIHQFLVFCSLVGCALTPILFIPLTSGTNYHNEFAIALAANGNTSASMHAILRPPRSIAVNANFTMLSNQTNQVSVESIRLTSSPSTNAPSVPANYTSDMSTSLLDLEFFVNRTTAGMNLNENEANTTIPLSVIDATKPVLVNTSEAPMKPSFVDAEHLNQDSKSADGSNTAAKMKLVDDDFRHSISDDSEIVDVPEGNEIVEPVVVDANHLSESKVTSDANRTADEIEHVDKTIIESDSESRRVTIPPLLSDKPDVKTTTVNSSKPSVSTIPIPLWKNNSDFPHPTIAKDSPTIIEPKRRSNDSYRLTSSHDSKWDRRAPCRWHDEHMRHQYMKSVRYVYVAIGLLTIMAWFISIPLTGLISYVRPCIECITIQTLHSNSPKGDEQAEGAGSTSTPNYDVERTDCIEDPHRATSCPTETSSPPPSALTKNVYWSVDGADSQPQKGSAIPLSYSASNFAVLRSIRYGTSQARCKDVETADIDANDALDTSEQSVHLTYAPEPTIWPLVTLPTDFWLLVATFLFAGLETTYGAFIHSFTFRTLNWTKVDSLLVTTVFWSGDAIGRVCYLCLGTNSDMGVSLLQNATNFLSNEASQSPSQHNRRGKSYRIASLVVRTLGSFICLICACTMKEITSSHLVHYQSGSVIYDSWSAFRDRATWMVTMGLGLGLGVIAGSGINVCNARGNCLYLAMLLGQLAVPATSGYLTERVLHKNASETLGRTIIVLSILMFLSLFVDLFLQVARHFSCWAIVTDRLSCYPKKEEEEKEDESKLTARKNSIAADNYLT